MRSEFHGAARRAVLAAALTGAIWPHAAGAAEARIEIADFAFSPPSVTVAPGTKVTWINRDEEAHQVAGADKAFRGPALDTGDSFSVTFRKAGTYAYFCTLHPQMTGTVTVK